VQAAYVPGVCRAFGLKTFLSQFKDLEEGPLRDAAVVVAALRPADLGISPQDLYHLCLPAILHSPLLASDDARVVCAGLGMLLALCRDEQAVARAEVEADWLAKVQALALRHREASVRREALRAMEWAYATHSLDAARAALVAGLADPDPAVHEAMFAFWNAGGFPARLAAEQTSGGADVCLPAPRCSAVAAQLAGAAPPGGLPGRAAGAARAGPRDAAQVRAAVARQCREAVAGARPRRQRVLDRPRQVLQAPAVRRRVGFGVAG
jgi:hypothetical protein